MIWQSRYRRVVGASAKEGKAREIASDGSAPGFDRDTIFEFYHGGTNRRTAGLAGVVTASLQRPHPLSVLVAYCEQRLGGSVSHSLLGSPHLSRGCPGTAVSTIPSEEAVGRDRAALYLT